MLAPVKKWGSFDRNTAPGVGPASGRSRHFGPVLLMRAFSSLLQHGLDAARISEAI